MLKSLRKSANSIFIKALLIALAAMFVVWGVGDVLRGSSVQTVATVGGQDVTQQEYQSLYERFLNDYQLQLGKQLSEEQINLFGIRKQALNNLIERKLITQKISDVGLTVGDNAVKEQLAKNSLFHNENGKFDRNVLQAVLSRYGLSESGFIESVTDDINKEIFFDALAVAPATLAMQGNFLYQYYHEKRKADLIVLSPTLIKESDIGEPEETQLVKFYQENQEVFRVPEYRAISYLTFDMHNIAKPDVSDEEVLAEYEAQKDRFLVPNSRSVEQFLYESKEEAEKDFLSLKENQESKVAEQTDLGGVTEGSLPDVMAKAIFALNEGEYSQPVNSALGWHVFHVTKISESYIQPFDEVKTVLLNELEEKKRLIQFYSLINDIEDDLAAGVTLEEIAKKYDLTTHSIASLDRSGKGKNDQLIEDLPEKGTFLELSFSLTAGEESPLTMLNDNETHLLLRVNEVAPERIKALDEMKGAAIAMWKRDEKERLLKELAQKTYKQLEDGKKAISDVAKNLGVEVKAQQSFERPSDSLPVLFNDPSGDTALRVDLFSLKVGQATKPYKDQHGRYTLAKLVKVEAPAKVKQDEMDELEQSIKDDIVDEILDQFSRHMHEAYPIKVNSNATQ